MNICVTKRIQNLHTNSSLFSYDSNRLITNTFSSQFFICQNSIKNSQLKYPNAQQDIRSQSTQIKREIMVERPYE